MSERLVIIGSDRDSLRYLAGELAEVAEVKGIVIEPKVPVSRILSRRMKTFGVLHTLGQAAFAVLLLPIIRIASRAREEEIVKENGMDGHPIAVPLLDVPSVNSPECVAQLAALAPTVVLVYGTRIITGKTLRAVGVPFINIHAGLTPWYRGGHGAYWALYNREPDRAGVTVHRVDTGIDTGGILAQAPIAITSRDTIATYPTLQLAAAARLVHGLLHQGPATWQDRKEDATTKKTLYAHPALWEYVLGRFRGVK